MNYYNGRVCLNVLAGSLDNAGEIYDAAEGFVAAGVLSANYPDVQSAVEDMNKYMEILDGNLSVGLGGGNPAQWKAVADIGKEIKANHFNQVFSAVGYTRANIDNTICHITALVSHSGIPGLVKISTGPLSMNAKEPANIPVDTAIAMIREMGGNSIKFFPMGGLQCREELQAVADACSKNDFILEPTGGITMENFREIMQIIIAAGVKKIIPHVYSAIIDKSSGNTRPEQVKELLNIVKELV